MFYDGHLHLNNLLQKSLRYDHHRENYIQSLRKGVIPTGLKLKKKPAIIHISDEFEVQWSNVLYDDVRYII